MRLWKINLTRLLGQHSLRSDKQKVCASGSVPNVYVSKSLPINFVKTKKVADDFCLERIVKHLAHIPLHVRPTAHDHFQSNIPFEYVNLPNEMLRDLEESSMSSLSNQPLKCWSSAVIGSDKTKRTSHDWSPVADKR